MTDYELVMFCLLKLPYGSFTGNELKNKLKLNSNQIHIQLFRCSKKYKQLNRFIRDNQTYYYIEL